MGSGDGSALGRAEDFEIGDEVGKCVGSGEGFLLSEMARGTEQEKALQMERHSISM